MLFGYAAVPVFAKIGLIGHTRCGFGFGKLPKIKQLKFLKKKREGRRKGDGGGSENSYSSSSQENREKGERKGSK
jgi:hypothetical protein